MENQTQTPTIEATPEPTTNTQNTAGSTSAETINAEIMIPKTRLDEALKRAKEAETLLAQIEADKKKAEEEKLKAQGEWEKIAAAAKLEAEALKPQAALAERYGTAMRAMLETRKKGVPEHLMPLLDKLELDEALKWLDENAEKLNPKPAPNTNAGERGERGKVPVDPNTVLKRRSY